MPNLAEPGSGCCANYHLVPVAKTAALSQLAKRVGTRSVKEEAHGKEQNGH